MTVRSFAIAGLILAAALTRLLPHPPNFAPITALAVFGAIRYGDRRAAILGPLLALLVSDLAREFLYRWGLAEEWGLYRDMWVVYGVTALIAMMARLAQGTRSPLAIAATTLAGSCLFFLVTNFAFWTSGLLYPVDSEGLLACYTAALPFFRNALLGDVFYTTVLFGAWAVAEASVPALRVAPAGA
jgi:hypothetical protein